MRSHDGRHAGAVCLTLVFDDSRVGVARTGEVD
jgi:hypothetical protein